MKRVVLFFTLICAAMLVVAAVTVFAEFHGAKIPLLAPAGPIARAEMKIILVTFAFCALVVIPVFASLFFFAWKYRADGPMAHIHHRPNWDHDSRAAEFSWWVVPTAIIVVLGIIAWKGSHELDPYKPLSGANPLTVEVVALDWKWLFLYPAQGVASVNLLMLPVNVPVHFELTANAPMNSFWIPALGGQIMVMPGMQTQLNLMADKAGSYNGLSGNISGDGFAGMTFTAKAVSQNDFRAWVARVQSSSIPLDTQTFAQLTKPSEYNAVQTYNLSDPDLYTGLIMSYMKPPTASSATMP